jgi:hypothetical protein
MRTRRRSCSKSAGRAEELVWKYLLLVAIATSEWAERWKALSDTDLSDLEWGELLWKLMKAQEAPTSSATKSFQTGNAPTAFLWNRRDLVLK